MTEFQMTMAFLMGLATVVFIITIQLMVNPTFRTKFLEFFPTVRGRNGKPFTWKEKIGLTAMALVIVVVILI